MTPPTAVLLIPGFFGFAAFGPDAHPIVEYFGGVRNLLQRHLKAPDYFVVAHEPPPTGSIDERVGSLHDAVHGLLAGDKLPHATERFQAKRVHLIGHSTGGVDARLFANPAFLWRGGPSGDARTAPLAALGEIITISSPFRGTPVATHARFDRDAILQGVQLMTMLGVLEHDRLDLIGLRSLLVNPRGRRVTAILASVAGLPRRLLAHIAAGGPGLTRQQTADVGDQVRRFFGRIDSDRQLLDDLTVSGMQDIVARAPHLERTDHPRIHSYVSVSPPPSWSHLFGLDPIQRLVYEILYRATAHDPMGGAPPRGRLIGPSSVIPTLVSDPCSCDGVVPTRSQTLKGEAAGIILGDHLDVVGSYEGGHGINVMRSGASFADDRFSALWSDVAGKLLNGASKAQ